VFALCTPRNVADAGFHVCQRSFISVISFILQTTDIKTLDLIRLFVPSKLGITMGTMAESDDAHRPYTYARGIDNLPPPLQFTFLAVGVFFFFGIHNLLQEAIMNVPGFTYGVMLGYMEVLGVAVCSLVERRYIAKEHGRKAPLSAYPLLTMCLLASSALSNMSLNYINFPTKVVFRSCKLIPTMVIASFLHKKIFSIWEYICALAICVGLVLFAAADWELRPSFNPIGLGLVSMSVVADSILPNAQERLFRSGSSRLEVTLYTNTFTLIVMTFTTMISGDLVGALQQTLQNRQLLIYFTIYTFVAYAAISAHMSVVKRFGGVVAVLLATGRKGMTLILSFVLFPKGFSWFYPAGAVLVLGGLLVSSLVKMQSKNTNKEVSSSTEHHQLKHHASDIEFAQPSKN
jgi:adenosine 3'-phospho 5'-phosphosulfate transporter B3